MVFFVQDCAGAVPVSVDDEMKANCFRPEQFKDDTKSWADAIEDVLNAAWNDGVNTRKIRWQPIEYVLDRKVTAGGLTQWQGEGNVLNNAGTILKYTGSDAQMFEFSTYASGSVVENICFDTTSVTTPVQTLKFATGLNGFTFRNCKWKGYHSGPSWGGTYADHDAIHVVGGSGGTKYDFSNGLFEQCQFVRMRDAVSMSGDPASGGPGNAIKFDTCFFWSKRNSAKLFGANNTFVNCEFNTESGAHTIVQSGQYAVAWRYTNCNWQTASSGSGNEIIHADTAGSANIASIEDGTLYESYGGGFPELVLDAGQTGSAIKRFKTHGVVNYDSRVLQLEQIRLAVAQDIGEQNFYLEDHDDPWVPAFSNLYVNLNGGSVTYSGKRTYIGDMCFWSAKVQPSGGATTRSVAGETFITNMPGKQIGVPCNCTASNSGTIASYGVGQGDVGSNNMFMPDWPAVSNGIAISGFYFTDRS